MATQRPLVAYVPLPTPTLPDAAGLYLTRELQRIQNSIAGLITMTPQPATSAPSSVFDGMIRLARSPWRPIGGSVDAWVYYDGPSRTWKAL